MDVKQVLPADMEAEAKAELNKKAHSAVILCLGNKVLREVTGDDCSGGLDQAREFSLTLEDMVATLNLKEIKERSKAKWDDGKGLYDHLKRNCPKNNHKKSTSYVKKDDQPSSSGSTYDDSEVMMNAMVAVYSWVSNRSEKSEVLCKVEGTTERWLSFELNKCRVFYLNKKGGGGGWGRDNCVYSLDGHAMAGELNASVEEKDSLAQVWHKRLGHISEAGLQCWKSKSVCGKESLDLGVPRSQVIHWRFKHEAFGKFKEWKQLVENQTGRTVKKLRTNNGLEFCNQEFEQLCIESGIARHLIVAGTPQ
ncbi:retrovirus-related pol polyprotein from transposon TNT 1-94 [Tanacetum coccineum]